jgi:hypothetical protein
MINQKTAVRLLGVTTLALLWHVWSVGRAVAQDEGCCQFFTRAGAQRHGQRQCDDTKRQECTVLRARSTFLEGWHCDSQTQRCTAKLLGPTPTPTAIEQIGCCQLHDLRGVAQSVCGNEVSDFSCANDFAGTSTFCADCVCSSHPSAGFDLAPGACVPKPTPTPAPSEVLGCCQLDNLRGAPSSICGNAIRQSSCFSDFTAQPTFCKNCSCSSHSSSGFDLTRGACVAPGGSRRPRHGTQPPSTPQHPSSG